MAFFDTFKVIPQYILPQHALSKLMSKFTHSKNKALKSYMINKVIKLYGVNMAEALPDNPERYESFNDFFTRSLRPLARSIASGEKDIVSPADGAVSQVGKIKETKIFQAKGKLFSTVDLLGGVVERAIPFMDGEFATIYLSPKDYHRLHMPLTGTLKEMVHVPGKLFSVNAATTRSVSGLFAKNERVVCLFDTAAGPMALVLVGAIFVSSIETVWHGVVTPPSAKIITTWNYGNKSIVLKKGEEMGRFNMGSTIIVLFGKGKMQWDSVLQADELVKMGSKIGKITV